MSGKTVRHVATAFTVGAVAWLLLRIGWALYGPANDAGTTHVWRVLLLLGVPTGVALWCLMQRHPNHK